MTITWNEMRQKAEASGYFKSEPAPINADVIQEGDDVRILSGATIFDDLGGDVSWIDYEFGFAQVHVYGTVAVAIEDLVLDV